MGGAAAAATAGAGAGGLAGALAGGMLSGYAPGAAFNPTATAGGPGMIAGTGGLGGNPEEMAGCLGLTVDEYRFYLDPTGGQPRAPTNDEVKRQRKIAKKMDLQRYQACAMQQQSAQTAATQQMMARAQAPTALTSAAAGVQSAPKSVGLASDLGAELKKGKTTIRDIDWTPGAGEVSPAGTPGFTEAMTRLAVALAEAGGAYRADFYLDQAEGVDVSTVGAARLAVVQAALEAGGAVPGTVTAGKTKKDKNPRLEIVKVK